MRPEREEFSGIWIYICDQLDEKVVTERAIAFRKQLTQIHTHGQNNSGPGTKEPH